MVFKSALAAGVSFLMGGQFGQSVDVARHRYQRLKPVTTKNIGRNYLRNASKYEPHQGERECARRRDNLRRAA